MYDDHIHPLNIFYWSRLYWYLLLRNLLSFWPDLGMWPLPAFADVFNIRAWASISLLSLNFSFSLLLYLQFLSKFVALLYHCPILLEKYSVSMSFLLIIPFIPLLNFLINSLLLYLLFFTTLLNFCTNSSIVLLPYSTFFNSTIFFFQI